MNEKLAAFVKSLTYWLDQEHEIEATVANPTENECDLNLWLEDASDDDDEDVEVGNNFYIGTFADPGMHITWLGEYDLGEKEKTELVRINGVVFEALGRQIAGWAVGSS